MVPMLRERKKGLKCGQVADTLLFFYAENPQQQKVEQLFGEMT